MKRGSKERVEAIKQAAHGRWIPVLNEVGGIPLELLDGQHHPCPKCGGKDRFRLVDEAAGAVFCNQCFDSKNGDGLSAIQWMRGVSFLEAVDLTGAHIGYVESTTNRNATNRTVTPGSPAANGSAIEDTETDADNDQPVTATTKERISDVYTYLSANGDPVFRVLRLRDPKEFKQQKFDGVRKVVESDAAGRYVREADGRFRLSEVPKWSWGIKGVNRILYRLPEIIALPAGSRVFIVEGEKSANRLAELGLAATCSSGGGCQWRKTDEKSRRAALAGHHVVVLPDNDEKGKKHARMVAEDIHKVAASVRILELPSLNDAEDVFDWVSRGGTAEELNKLSDAAPEADASTWSAPVRFTNYRALFDDDGKVERYAIGIREIEKQILDQTGGWPKRLGSNLFVEASGRARFLRDDSDLFGWLATFGEIAWTGGGTGLDHDGVSFVSRSMLYREFAGGEAVESVDSISPCPLEPCPAGVYVLSRAVPKSGDVDGSYLKAFLKNFNFAEVRDEALGQALILSPFWGGPPGARPLILITGPGGLGVQESGKSTLAELLLGVAGAPFVIDVEKFGEPVTKQLLSNVALDRSSVLIDNVDVLGGRELASLTPTSEIPSRPAFGENRCRVNRLTWAATAVSATLDADLLSRAFVLRIAPCDIEAWPTFRLEMDSFLAEHRGRLTAEALAALRPDSRRFAIRARHSRFPAWDIAVLSTHPACNLALEARAGDLAHTDSDIESIAAFGRAILAAFDGGQPGEQVIAPTRLAEIWNGANPGHRVNGVWMTRRLREWGARGKLAPGIRQQKRKLRGAPWIIDMSALSEWVEEESATDV